MSVFNPYKDALGDASMLHNATRQWHKTMCFACGNEKPIKGGTFPHKKGEKMKLQTGGILRKFICADCLEKRAKVQNETTTS